MSHPRLTRRRLLAGTVGLASTGLAGCLGAPSAAAGGETPAEETPSAGTDTPSSENDQPGHAEEAHGHDLVSEPKPAREVAINTARSGDTTEYHFDPHVTWIEPGGTVTWRLESGVHTATAYHPGNDQPRLVPEGTSAWDSGMLTEAGETFEHTFETEGVYHYLCEPHETFGMIATVVVGEPHPEEEAAVGTIPDDKPDEVQGKLEELNGMVREILGEGHGGAADDGHEDAHAEEATEHGHEGDETTVDDHEEQTTEHGHEDDSHDEPTTTDAGHDEDADAHDDATTTDDGHHH